MAGIREATATDAVLGHVAAQLSDDGAATGARVIAVSPAGGVHARVLVDRGLDIGAAWFGGQPVAWLSANGEHRNASLDEGEGWHSGWAGGLVTTCGLQNVGAPTEGHGRHGQFTSLAADDVSVDRTVQDDGTGEVVISGRLTEAIGLGRGIVVRRTLRFPLQPGEDGGTVELEDEAVNESPVPLQSPLLYHVNFGYPFLDSDSVPLLQSDGAFIANAASQPMGPPIADHQGDEVLELAVNPDPTGWALAALESRRLQLRAVLSWQTKTLPRLFTWQRRAAGSYVCALEPANCSVQGRAFDRAQSRHPMLAPGERRRTVMRIAFERMAGSGERR
jgi:hypothetical protein